MLSGACRSLARSLTPLVLAGALLLVGCGKKGIESELQAFKDAGRNVSTFTESNAAALGAQRCQTGTIDGVQTLLCEFGSSDAATAGLPSAQSWLGEVQSGLVLRRDLVILALADRNGADPSGQSMSSLIKIFRRTSRK